MKRDYIVFLATLFLIGPLIFLSQYGQQDTLFVITTHAPKWIVVTSVQYPTEDIKNLAGQLGWAVVVVADTKTPKDWNYPGVHFLSIEMQKQLFGKFAKQLPYKSYTRKNLGYLYAMINGAEWIYDTDDDNKPYGLGLAQFDYNESISGLQYISKSNNISEKLFNPYRFYGFDNMWPRGFPLEYYEDHTNGKNRMVSCRDIPRPVVQQGIVKADPDVDAIYRLLHAEKGGGLDVTFNSIAPPITLGSGTYSPWNSQNTLFHYRAFFIMYLPTTVAFRVTDIWRSYFGQKLLHLIGENVAFYPTNAVQIRNAHNYLSDFHQEIDVYEQSGKIVEFLDNWNCSDGDVVDCTLELADDFVENNFFGKEDRNLIEEWLKQLKHFGFPSLVNETEPLSLGKKYSNCRTANLDVGVNTYRSDKEKIWAIDTVNRFWEVLEWCEMPNDTDTFLPPPGEFLHFYKRLTGLQKKRETVLVMLSNSNWRPEIVGLLQRMYSPFFKTTVFCGAWADASLVAGPLPATPPLNFIYITPEEMRKGHSYGYCVSKVKDLRLQNVTGYYFVADDTTFNIFNDLPLDKLLNPMDIGGDKYWWRPAQIQSAYNLFEGKYKKHPSIGKSWQEYKETLQRKYPNKTVTDQFQKTVLKLLSDFLYIPSSKMEYIGNLMEVMVEAEVFVEVAFAKIMDGLDYNRGGSFKYLWDKGRYNPWVAYNSSIVGVHPIKLGSVVKDPKSRKYYCDTVVKAFGQRIYGLKK